MSPENPKKREEGEEAYDDPPMTLWDHLKDLRKRMFYSIVAFALCAGIAWEFRELLLSLLVKPYADAWWNGTILSYVILVRHVPS